MFHTTQGIRENSHQPHTAGTDFYTGRGFSQTRCLFQYIVCLAAVPGWCGVAAVAAVSRVDVNILPRVPASSRSGAGLNTVHWLCMEIGAIACCDYCDYCDYCD